MWTTGTTAAVAITLALGVAPAARAEQAVAPEQSRSDTRYDCMEYSYWTGDSSHSNAFGMSGSAAIVRAYVKRNYGGTIMEVAGSWGKESHAQFSAGYAYESHYWCQRDS